MKERIYMWDSLKAILMMLVVMTHSVCIYQYAGCRWVQYYWVFIMTFTMPLFTIISGYFFKERDLQTLLKKYLYPAILFSVVNGFLGYIFMKSYVNYFPLTRLGYAMWYLEAMFLYYLITPFLLKKIGFRKIVILSLVSTIVAGLRFIPNPYMDACRLISFYPFFLFGIWLKNKKEYSISNATLRTRRIFCLLFVLLCFAYMVAVYIVPGICYFTGFTETGLGLKGSLLRCFAYIMTTLMSVALIMSIPRRELWFTKYGKRTMNQYLLHMSLVFPLCWGVLGGGQV